MGVVYLRLPDELHEQLTSFAARRSEPVASLVRRMVAGYVKGEVGRSQDDVDEGAEALTQVTVRLTPSETREVDRRCGPTGRQRGPWIARVVREALTNRRQHFSVEEVVQLERVNVSLDQILMDLAHFRRAAREVGRTPVMSADATTKLETELRAHMADVRTLLAATRGREPIGG